MGDQEMTVRIYSYNPYSASAKALSEVLNIRRIKHENSKYKPKVGDRVINWGSSKLPPDIMTYPAQVINNPDIVKSITNKLSFFRMMDKDLVVPWTEDRQEVLDWLNAGKDVVVRHNLTGHSGEGIQLIDKLYIDNGNPIPLAPLYTLYTPKKDEYRIHCAKIGNSYRIFDRQQKRRKLDVADEQVNWKIRNLDGGFIYSRENIEIHDCVDVCALEIFKATGLDFGAIDIIYNNHKNKAYCLEVNTAPGLTGTTLERYADTLVKIVRGG